jgi:hypothetical protein
MVEKIKSKKLYDEKELIPLAMVEQFALHHLGGDVEVAEKAIKNSLTAMSKDVE